MLKYYIARSLVRTLMNLAMNRSRNICVGQQGVMIYIYVFFPRPSGHVLITHSVLWYTKFIKTYILFFLLIMYLPMSVSPTPFSSPTLSLYVCLSVCRSQKPLCWRQFQYSTMWALGVKLPVLATSTLSTEPFQ